MGHSDDDKTIRDLKEMLASSMLTREKEERDKLVRNCFKKAAGSLNHSLPKICMLCR